MRRSSCRPGPTASPADAAPTSRHLIALTVVELWEPAGGAADGGPSRLAGDDLNHGPQAAMEATFGDVSGRLLDLKELEPVEL